MEIRHMGPGDEAAVMAAGHLFDDAPTAEWTAGFLRRPGHHLLVAFVDDVPAGFVSGIEIAHPDKATELLVYELGVDEPFRRRGIGRALVMALSAIADSLGARGLWVPTESDNTAAVATYRSAGFDEPEFAVIMNRDLQAGNA